MYVCLSTLYLRLCISTCLSIFLLVCVLLSVRVMTDVHLSLRRSARLSLLSSTVCLFVCFRTRVGVIHWFVFSASNYLDRVAFGAEGNNRKCLIIATVVRGDLVNYFLLVASEGRHTNRCPVVVLMHWAMTTTKDGVEQNWRNRWRVGSENLRTQRRTFILRSTSRRKFWFHSVPMMMHRI